MQKTIEEQFRDQEYGGINELRLFKNGQIGAIGNIVYIDKEVKKHYYALVFTFNPLTAVSSPLRIIVTRKNFPQDQ